MGSIKEIIKPTVLKLSLFSLMLIVYIVSLKSTIMVLLAGGFEQQTFREGFLGFLLRIFNMFVSVFSYWSMLDILFFIGSLLVLYFIALVIEAVYKKIKA